MINLLIKTKATQKLNLHILNALFSKYVGLFNDGFVEDYDGYNKSNYKERGFKFTDLSELCKV